MKKKTDIINLTEKILEGLFFAILPFLFLRAKIFKVQLPFLTISMTSVKNAVILLGFVWFILFMFRGFKPAKKTSIDKYIVFFLLWFIISCAFAENIKLGFNALFVMLVYTCFYFVCAGALVSERKIKIVFYLLLICSVIAAVFDLIYHFKVGISDIVEKYPFWPGKQAISLFLVLSFLLLISAAVFNWKGTRRALRIVYVSVLAVQFVALFFVYSRGAVFTLLFSLLVIIFFKSRKIFCLILILMSLLMLFSSRSVREKLDNICTARMLNIKQRFVVWKTTLMLIKDNPIIGVGPGNFGTVHFEKYRQSGDEFGWWRKNYHAHNLYLQIASENGLVGLFIFLLLIWKIFTSGYRIIRNEKNNFILGARIGAYSAFLGFLFWSIAECSYTGEFSPLSSFHINLIIILYVNIILYLPAESAARKIQDSALHRNNLEKRYV